MSNARILRFAGAFAVTLALPALAQETATPAPDAGDAAAQTEQATATTPATADTVVATVNGTEITVGQMIALRDGLPDQYRQLPPDVLFDGILDQLIQQTALGAEADGPSKRTQVALENQERALLAGQVVQEVADAAVTDEALQKAYDDTYGNAEPTKEYSASHILVDSEDEAKAIAEEARGGADFAELAKEKSTGPSGPKGGDLGWFSPDMMVQPFAEAVAKMEPGEISDPVQTQFGWHVIKLNDTRDKAAPKMEDVRDELVATIQQDAVQKKVDEAVKAADVTKSTEGIDPSVLDDKSLLD